MAKYTIFIIRRKTYVFDNIIAYLMVMLTKKILTSPGFKRFDLDLPRSR